MHTRNLLPRTQFLWMVMQNLVYLFSTGCFLHVIPKHMTTSGRSSFNQYLNSCYFKSELQGNRALSRFFNPVFPEPRQGNRKWATYVCHCFVWVGEFCFDYTNNLTWKMKTMKINQIIFPLCFYENVTNTFYLIPIA